MTWVMVWCFFLGVGLFLLCRFIAGRRAAAATAVDIAARADQQTAWLAQGDLRGIYGEHMPPAMFLEPQHCALATAPSNDGTSLLTRAAAMVKRMEWIGNHYRGIRSGVDTEISVESLAILMYLDRCAEREHMTRDQFVDYVRGSIAYAHAPDDSVPLSALYRRAMNRVAAHGHNEESGRGTESRDG